MAYKKSSLQGDYLPDLARVIKHSGHKQVSNSLLISSRTRVGTSISKHQHLPDLLQSNLLPQRGQISFSTSLFFINSRAQG